MENVHDRSIDSNLSIHNDEHIGKIFEAIHGSQNIALICHDTPDPDTISPAFAISEYCSEHGIGSKIFYGGNIARLQNKALVNVLSINMINFIDLLKKEDGTIHDSDYPTQYINDNYDLIIFVDTSQYGGHGNVRFIKNIPNIIIDHHQLDIDSNGHANKILLMNHRCGSTASILSYMFKRKNVEISKEVGTALFIGLMSDTNNMTCQGVCDLDQEANSYLLRYIDFSIYNRIMNYEMPLELLNIRRIAYGDYLFRRDNMVITGVGYLKPEFKDLTAVIADEIIRTEGIQKVITVGIVEERNNSKAIVASVRTLADTVNTDLFCKHIFGQKFAGAKQGSGGAYIPIDGMASNILKSNKDQFFQLSFEYYKKRILEEHTNV